MLGWYNIRQKNMTEAEKWFRKAREEEDSASASQGLALALIDRNEPREAEDVMYKWRTASDDALATYLAATANLLALQPPVVLPPDVLQRIAVETMARKDAATAQQFGWYSLAFRQTRLRCNGSARRLAGSPMMSRPPMVWPSAITIFAISPVCVASSSNGQAAPSGSPMWERRAWWISPGRRLPP